MSPWQVRMVISTNFEPGLAYSNWPDPGQILHYKPFNAISKSANRESKDNPKTFRALYWHDWLGVPFMSSKQNQLREVIPKKKMLTFGYCPKVALTTSTPPPFLRNVKKKAKKKKPQHFWIRAEPPLPPPLLDNVQKEAAFFFGITSF